MQPSPNQAPAKPAELVPLLRCVALLGNYTVRYARKLVAKGCVQVDGRRAVNGMELVGNASRVIVTTRSDCGSIEEQVVPPRNEYYLKLFKPRGVICSHRQESKSTWPVISALYPAGAESCHPCGRLDRKSEGLLLITTDGFFTRSVTNPECNLEKEYLVVTNCARDRAPPPDSVLKQLREGVLLPGGSESWGRAEVAEVVDFDGCFARLRLVVTSGKFHLIRRMMAAVDYSCLQLLRTRVACVGGAALRPATMTAAASEDSMDPQPRVRPATLGDPDALRPGEFAPLQTGEVVEIYQRGLVWLQEQHPV